MISSEAVTGGDLRFIYNSMYDNYSIFPYAWLPNEGIGLGSFAGSLAWVYLVTSLPVIIFGSFLKQSWNMVFIFGYVVPFFLISFFSIKVLLHKLFGKNSFYILAFILYTVNTYILLVLGGGQVLIVLAYAVLPLTLLTSIISAEKILKLLQKPDFVINFKKDALKQIFITGVVFSIQLLLDPRIAYIAFVAILIYLSLQFFFFIKQNLLSKLILIFTVFVIPLIIAAFINMFWILPTILLRQNPLESFGNAYTTLDAVKYFSFAKLENSISLLHPYWPENIFGKAYFMQPEFLLLPIFAFFSLTFLKKENLGERRYILFFALLAFLGAFLAKGANEPFGDIYLWMFNHVPGFILFRDPTKWYMLVALSFSVLIPFSIMRILNLLNSQSIFKYKKFMSKLFLLLVVLYLIFLVRPIFTGGLTGIFAYHNIPPDYKKLEQFISKDNFFYRTLWFPQTQRFGFYSNIHSMVSANNLFNVYDLPNLNKKIHEPNTKELLQNLSIKYIIVPFDSEKEIFLKDRKYNEIIYLETVRNLSSIKWLKKIDIFGKVAVFEVADPKDHFWTTSKNITLKYESISPVEYRIDLKNVKEGDLLFFSESFDLGWVLLTDNQKINSKQFKNQYNGFNLEKEGNYSLKLYYSPQFYINLGSAISILSLTLVLIVLKFGYSFKK